MIEYQPTIVRDPGAIGILGGTFDPIHLGHLALAREAQEELGLDHVLFVPNADPPHKQAQLVSPARDREAMVIAAIADEQAFRLSRIELQRAGPSYAVDTVVELAERSREEGRPEPWFIMSAEAFAEFDTWREPDRILEHCRIAVAPRPGAPPLDLEELSRRYPGRDDRVTYLPGPELDITATDIRARVAAGQSIDGLVPAPVARYIRSHGLYRHGAAEPLADPDGAVEDTSIAGDETPPAADTKIDRPGPSEVAATASSGDPRTATRPGLPSSRRAEAAGSVRPTVEKGPVDEAVLALAHRIVELAQDKKASDIVLLDVRGQTTMTDYFVICSGASDRQLNAIADGIEAGARDAGAEVISREGDASSHWLLVDYGGVIVHVMSGPERDFYQLEQLWSEASLLLRIL